MRLSDLINKNEFKDISRVEVSFGNSSIEEYNTRVCFNMKRALNDLYFHLYMFLDMKLEDKVISIETIVNQDIECSRNLFDYCYSYTLCIYTSFDKDQAYILNDIITINSGKIINIGYDKIFLEGHYLEIYGYDKNDNCCSFKISRDSKINQSNFTSEMYIKILNKSTHTMYLSNIILIHLDRSNDCKKIIKELERLVSK